MACCGRWLLWAVAVTAVACGVGVWQLPVLDRTGTGFAKGIIPAVHRNEPYGFSFAGIPDLSGKVAVVTGANVGLGYYTALHLARRGAHTVLGCRSMDRCGAAAAAIRANSSGAAVTPLLLDLSSMRSVRSFAAEVRRRHSGGLHSLVLNAGVMMTPHQLSADGIELQFATNHVGHHLLAAELMPLLAAAAPSTVVSVASNGQWLSYPEGVRLTLAAVNDEGSYDRAMAYGQSKLANVLFALELAERAPAGVRVNVVHPGMVMTELGRHVEEAVKAVVGQSAGERLSRAIEGFVTKIAWDAETASLTQLYAAVAPAVTAGDGVTGTYFHPIARPTKPCPHALDADLRRRLWEFTERLIAEAAPSG